MSLAVTLSSSPAVGRSRSTAPPDAFSSSITSAMRRRALTKSITTTFSLRDAIQSASDTAQIRTRTGGHPISNRNKNAGPEPAPTRPARRPSITSPVELAVHLGRELSASAVDGNGWTDLQYAAALDWLAMALALLAAAAPVDPRLRTDGEALDPRLLSTLNFCGQGQFNRFRRTGATALHIAAAADACGVVALLLDGGADPDAADATTATPLHCAAAGHSGSAAAVLAARGADVGATTAKASRRCARRRGGTRSPSCRCCWTTGPMSGRRTAGAIPRCIGPRRATRCRRPLSCSTAPPRPARGPRTARRLCTWRR